MAAALPKYRKADTKKVAAEHASGLKKDELITDNE